jgi:4-amino-4-deoxy-L-arabinose transferase-like glycosyltransferase
MPIYEEKRISRKKSLFILGLAFFMIYLPFQMNDRELRWREGYFAAMALEMDLSSPSTVAHGEVISSEYPLFPLIVSVFYRSGISLEFGLRSVSVISLLIIVLLAWEVGRRAAGVQTAIVSASLVFSSVLMVEKSLDGYPDMLGVLCIFSGWIIWFTYGPARGQWNHAWLFSSLFCGLAFYTIGWMGVFLFWLPLLFMRRPMTIWSRLKKTGFFAGLAVIVFFILVWGIPRWIVGADIPLRNIPFKPEHFTDYLKHIMVFPFELFFRIMPVSLFAWPAFCPAYTPLDKNPVFSRFLKTIVATLFFFLWFFPFTDPRDYIVIVPPLAILAGINYWLLARRLGFKLHALLKVFSYAGIVCAALAVLFYIVPVIWWTDVVFLKKGVAFRQEHMIMGLCQAIAAVLILTVMLRRTPLKCNVWLHSLAVCVSGALLYWSIIFPYQTQDRPQEFLAKQIREYIGDDFHPGMTIYKEANLGLYSACSYLYCAEKKSSFLSTYHRINIRKVKSYKELPENQKTIYLISDEVPVLPGRRPDKFQLADEKKIYLWKETLTTNGKTP